MFRDHLNDYFEKFDEFEEVKDGEPSLVADDENLPTYNDFIQFFNQNYYEESPLRERNEMGYLRYRVCRSTS